MPSDKRDIESWDESEFGLGEGFMDSRLRADRVLEPWQELTEIRSLPKTFDGSMPERPTQQETPVPRLLPGEQETDRA